MAVQEKDPRKTPAGGSRPARSTSSGPGAPRPARGIEDDPGPLSMTGIRSGLLHSVFVKVMLGLLIFIFAVGFAITSIGGPGPEASAPRAVGGGPDLVAKVGDESIQRDKFQTAMQRTLDMNSQFGQTTPVEQLLMTRQSTLQQLTDEAARYEEAKARGITATDEEIEKKIDEEIKNMVSPPGESAAAARRRIEARGVSIADFEKEMRDNITDEGRQQVARQIVLEKLEKQIKDANKVSEDDYKRSMSRLKLRQIKISPKPAVAPPGAKNFDYKAAAAKNEAEAKARAEKLAASLKNANAAQFAAAAKKESDDIATKKNGGDLGAKMPTELFLPANVKDAVLAAKGNFVGPVQDEQSKEFYLFLIENRKLELPKDYAKKKKDYLKTFEDQQDNEAWRKFDESLKKKYTAEVYDPAVEALRIQNEKLYSAQGDEQAKLRQEAIDKYNEALTYASETERAAIHYQLAQLYQGMGQADKHLEELKAAAANPGFKQASLEYARALRSAKKDAEALKQLTSLSEQLDKNPAPPPMFGGPSPDDNLRTQIAGEFMALQKPDLAKKEQAKIKPPQAQPGMPGMPGGINLGGGGNPITINPSR